MTQSQIEEKFESVEGLNEAKKVYKELAKKLHPDVGGDNEMFKMLNDVYNNILENGLNFLNEDEYNVPIC